MHSNTGFSLIELILALAILAICAAFAVPNFQHFFQHAQATVQAERLFKAIALTQHEAVLRNVPVTLCGSDDQQSCSATWHNGYIIFNDENLDVTPARHEPILYAVTTSPTDGSLFWRSSFHRDYLTFYPNGSDRGETGTFWYCQRNHTTPSWAVVVNQAGRARYVTETAALTRYTCETGLSTSNH
jgi:type IV fimbrial biogenesis protein FimT